MKKVEFFIKIKIFDKNSDFANFLQGKYFKGGNFNHQKIGKKFKVFHFFFFFFFFFICGFFLFRLNFFLNN